VRSWHTALYAAAETVGGCPGQDAGPGGVVRALRWTEHRLWAVAGSSIGRTPDFGSGGWRFEPSPASEEIPGQRGFLAPCGPRLSVLCHIRATSFSARRSDTSQWPVGQGIVQGRRTGADRCRGSPGSGCARVVPSSTTSRPAASLTARSTARTRLTRSTDARRRASTSPVVDTEGTRSKPAERTKSHPQGEVRAMLPRPGGPASLAEHR